VSETEEIVGHAIAQLQRQFHCPYVSVSIDEQGVLRRLGSAGACAGEPDETISVTDGPIAIHLAFTYGPEADSEFRRECRIFAESVANACAALSFVRAAEEGETGRLLICDDDEGIRLLMRHVLRRDGFEVIEAPNGLVAHARALEFRPDLIIIDWMMPVLDGHDAVVRLKADPFTAATPILMLTSRSQSSDKVAALGAGVQDFLAKPFEPAALTQAVRRQLRWRRLLADEKSDVVPTALVRTDVPDGVALAHFVEIAEAAEDVRAFDDAAQAYTRAAELASNPDISNKFRRLSGKMYLTLAETSVDTADIQRGYTNAARAFLTAGNMSLAQAAHHSGLVAAGVGS
jgi:DNA-binding response OmpR family regulator